MGRLVFEDSLAAQKGCRDGVHGRVDIVLQDNKLLRLPGTQLVGACLRQTLTHFVCGVKGVE